MMIGRVASVLVVFAGLSGGCSSGPQSFRSTGNIHDTEPSEPKRGPGFENPGGMWMPEQLTAQAETLSKIGFEIDAQTLSDPTKAPLAAVISLGGCSASFVSPEGLIITNHHCVIRSLQVNSTPELNLLERGFVAKSRADEPSNGPTSRVFVTQSFKDVTREIRDGLADASDDLARFSMIEAAEKTLVSDCEKGRPELRCSVVNYFEGAQYVLIQQLEIRDVRLVYAPPEMIGSYGGEIDNWQWPRHSGDFAFYRAYVGKDGKPADYATDNVPYKPPHYLKLASEPLRSGDPVMVAGYPAATSRLTTAAEVKEATSWSYPRRVTFCKEFIALLEELAKTDAEVAIKAEPLLRGLNNWLTNTRGMLDGLVRDGLAQKKTATEAALMASIQGDAGRKAKWGTTLEEMNGLLAAHSKHREADAMLWETTRMGSLLSAAQDIVRMAEERPKPDAERDPDYQERTWKRHEQSFQSLSKTYDRKLETALLAKVVMRELELAEPERSGVANLVLKNEAPTAENVKKQLDKIFGKTKLEDEKTRISMFQKGKMAELKHSTDPVIQLAMALRPLLKDKEERNKAYEGAMSVHRPDFVEALRAFHGGTLAPDANRTLRVTYGTVRGYRPKPTAEVYRPFTGLRGVVAKHTGKDPFDAPQALRDAVAAGKKGPYVDEVLGDVPVNFLADLDITGGNSGSATLNKRGELVGLVFDGNYEAMASDWVFMPDVTRSIHVDLRYILWTLDAVDHADALLTELGITPSLK